MKRVLFIQHGELDGPGLLGEVLAEQQIAMQTLHPWRGEALPDSLETYDGFLLGGGGQSAYQEEEYPYLIREKALVREAQKRRLPTLGICLGAQLIASALGAEVRPNSQKEVGFFPVTLLDAADANPLWNSLPPTLLPAHWHGDTFDLPPGAVLLAFSALTRNQLFAVDERIYGLQFHLEMTLPVLTSMVQDDSDWLQAAGVNPVEFLAVAKECLPNIAPTARKVFQRWTQLLDSI